MNPSGKKVSFAFGKSITLLPPTTLKYREDRPDSHPDPQGSAMRRSTGAGSPLLSPSLQQENPPPSTLFDRFFFGEDEEDLEAKIQSPRWVPPPSDTGARSLKRYGSLSTFHGESPIETSPTSAPRADGTDTIVPRPRDYSETQRLKEQEDLAKAAEAAELAAEQRRLEEESRQLEELKRESDIEEEFRSLRQRLDAIKEANAEIEKRKPKKFEFRRLKEEDDAAEAAEGKRRFEGDFREDAERRFTQGQPEEIGKRGYKTKAAEALMPVEIGQEFLEEIFRKHSKEEDQDVPMDGDSIEPPYTDGTIEVEKRRGSAAPPGRCHSCNRMTLHNGDGVLMATGLYAMPVASFTPANAS
ncbi:hypothetical protein J3E68DRAFT_422697 [Trichoderma sp. SZMC 28012]